MADPTGPGPLFAAEKAFVGPRIDQLPRATFNPNLARAIAAAAAAPTAVEIGNAPAVAKILRDGNEVVAPQINTALASEFIDKLGPINRINLPRVLSQSVPPGTFAARGTSVDLVLVPPPQIKVGLLQGAHVDLKEKFIPDLLPLVQDAAVAPVLQSTDDPTKLTADQKTLLTAKLKDVGAGIDENVPGKGFAAAFATLKGVQAFK
jgi:hypothetical protein